MADKRKKLEQMMSPVGTLIWPHLNRPDIKFAKDGSKGDYHTILRLTLSDPGVQDFVNAIRAKYEESVATGKERFKEAQKEAVKKKGQKLEWKLKDSPVKAVVEMVEGQEEPQETGEVDIRFKMAAFVKPKDKEGWWQEPALFDSKKNSLGKVAKAPRIGMGTTARVAFELNPFWNLGLGAGLSLRLSGVQILKLVEYTGAKSADMLGFGEEPGYEDDGFVFDSSSVEPSDDSGADPALVESEGGDSGADDFE